MRAYKLAVKILVSRLAIVVLLVCATACSGWGLRGYPEPGSANSASRALPNAIFLRFAVRDYRLIDAFKRVMDRYGVSHNDDADIILSIDSERLDRQAIAFTETGIAAQYQLELAIEYAVVSKGVKQSYRAQAMRSYDFDPVRISSEAAEEEKLKRELREELFIEILNRLAQSRV